MTLLPYVGPGWYPKVSLDHMLRCGVAQWSDVLHTMNAASHVTAECLAPALDVMEQAWPEGEEHMAKLAVNSMIGLMAHDSNKAYTLRSSSNELDATGADTRQVFYVGEGRYVWDFITTRSIHNNGTLRPIHDCVLGFKATMVARIRRELGLPPKYIKQVKTDCVVLQGMPRKFRDNLERLVHNTYPDGKPKFRHEETTKPLRGKHAPPCMQAEPPARAAGWTDVADPVAHCLAGRLVLLTGLPGTGKTHLARTIVTKLRERGEVVHLISKTHSAVQNLGAGAARRRPTTGCASTCGGPACSAWTGCWKRSRSSTWACGRTSRACP